MALRGKTPKETNRRLKALLYGDAGVGKTTAAIQMPKPYIVDTEAGTAHYGPMIEKAGGAVFASNDFGDVLAEVQELMTTSHPYRSFILDPFTPLFEMEVDKGEREVGTDFGKHRDYAAKPSKRLFNLLTRLDMNVIVTAHSKPKYVRVKDDKGKWTVVQEGSTFDGWKKLDYIFDLVLELQRDGKHRIAVVRKTRLAGFPDQDSFPWSFEELARRYGVDDLTRDAEPVVLATPEEVARLDRLVSELSMTDGPVVEKWLSKANVDTFAEMPGEIITACIVWCENKIKEVLS